MARSLVLRIVNSRRGVYKYYCVIFYHYRKKLSTYCGIIHSIRLWHMGKRICPICKTQRPLSYLSKATILKNSLLAHSSASFSAAAGFSPAPVAEMAMTTAFQVGLPFLLFNHTHKQKKLELWRSNFFFAATN